MFNGRNHKPKAWTYQKPIKELESPGDSRELSIRFWTLRQRAQRVNNKLSVAVVSNSFPTVGHISIMAAS
ncbi:hypothetical protein EYF80_040767 [Liparis tanakae]|uniref:Uncharacterized protein n=1 Tax=Liparis tanakae TaxID=230148 RepID=A0A4Z2G7A8_9TELE|nr:hypothetical protein EYF80_040767 [Liparis tanakae]